MSEVALRLHIALHSFLFGEQYAFFVSPKGHVKGEEDSK